MSDEILQEEFEVLESIYPSEITKVSDRELHIKIDPEYPVEGEEPIELNLHVSYPESYPDELPELSLELLDGDASPEELEVLLGKLKVTGEENLGIAMTFTLVSQLREELSDLVKTRAELRTKEEQEKERKAIEAEEARTRGTPVTVENFNAWKIKFDKEMAIKRQREEDEKLKSLTPKERDEYKKVFARPSGRQLFERNRQLDTSDAALVEEGSVSVDVSQYERTGPIEEEPEEERLALSDSDDD